MALCKRWFKLFDSVNEILMSDHTDQLKASEQFVPVTVYYAVQGTLKVVLTFEFVNKILKCDHSSESSLLPFNAVFFFCV